MNAISNTVQCSQYLHLLNGNKMLWDEKETSFTLLQVKWESIKSNDDAIVCKWPC